MGCTEADALFKRLIQATRSYVIATNTLANLIGARERFEAARLRVTETYAECKAARSALQTHREHHHCGNSSGDTADPRDKHTH